MLYYSHVFAITKSVVKLEYNPEKKSYSADPAACGPDVQDTLTKLRGSGQQSYETERIQKALLNRGGNIKWDVCSITFLLITPPKLFCTHFI